LQDFAPVNSYEFKGCLFDTNPIKGYTRFSVQKDGEGENMNIEMKADRVKKAFEYKISKPLIVKNPLPEGGHGTPLTPGHDPYHRPENPVSTDGVAPGTKIPGTDIFNEGPLGG
jgi:hypothetical protein